MTYSPASKKLVMATISTRAENMVKKDRGFLDNAYGLENPQATKTFYRDWAATYEEEVRANGYATPARCAQALAGLAADRHAPLLDLGCGTGLSGEAFRDAGFELIDGSDFSQDMLACARNKSGLYRTLIPSDLNSPLPGTRGDYMYIAAVGVFSPGHAPPELLDEVMAKLLPGGCFVFSLNDHALAAPGYKSGIQACVDSGVAEIAFREYGEHMPARDLKADVCVLRRK